MFCRKCGKELEDSWAVCPHCGEAIMDSQAKVTSDVQREVIIDSPEKATSDSPEEVIGDDSEEVTDDDSRETIADSPEEVMTDNPEDVMENSQELNGVDAKKTDRAMEKKKSNVRMILKVLALVALVCFFCPLYMVSCAGQEVCSMSGLDLTLGFQAMGEEIEGSFLWGIIALLPVVWFGVYSYAENPEDSTYYVGTACSGGLLLIMLFIDLALEDAGAGLMKVTPCAAATVIKLASLLASGAGGYLLFLEELELKTGEKINKVWIAVKSIGKTIGSALFVLVLAYGVISHFAPDQYENYISDTNDYDETDEIDKTDDTQNILKFEEPDIVSQDNMQKEETAEPEEEETVKELAEYIFPNSDSQYLSEEELLDLPVEALRVGRNEIFARHGYIFNDQELQRYFESTTWYKGTVKGEDFDMDGVLNKYEKANAELIKSIEERY